MQLFNFNIKKFLIFQEAKRQKKLLIFFQKKACLIFRERERHNHLPTHQYPPNHLYFRKRRFLIFQEELPKPQKLTFLIFLQK